MVRSNYGNANNCPLAEIPLLSSDVIGKGTYSSSTTRIAFDGKSYLLLLDRDLAGVQIANASEVV